MKYRIKKVTDGFGKVYYKIQGRKAWYRAWKYVSDKGDLRHPLVFYTYGREYETTIRREAEAEMRKLRYKSQLNERK